MSTTEDHGSTSRPRFYVEMPQARPVAGADAVIVASEACDDAEHPPEPRAAAFIWRIGPEGTPPQGALVCAVEGMGRAARIAQDFPDVLVIPRISARRVARRYGFDPHQDGSGFKTYHLNPATFSAFEVLEDGVAVGLHEWLTGAVDLGFGEIWLHALDAQEAGRGFACDLLDRAHRIVPEARFWLSGGGRKAEHVETVIARPGLEAVVLEPALLEAFLASRRMESIDDRHDPNAAAGT